MFSPWRNGRNILLTWKHRENHLKSNHHKVSEELKMLPDIVWHACNPFEVFKSIAIIIVFFDISVVLIWSILNSSYFPLPQLFCQNLLKHSIKKIIFLISQYKRAEIYKKKKIVSRQHECHWHDLDQSLSWLINCQLKSNKKLKQNCLGQARVS